MSNKYIIKENHKNSLVIKVGGAFMQDKDAALALLGTIAELQKKYFG